VQLELEVVPGRPWPVAGAQLDRLRVTLVALVVAPAVAQVDPAHEGQVALGVAGVADDDELLVVAAGRPDPLVQEDLAAGLVDHLAELEGFLLAELVAGMGAPQQPADLHAPLGQLGQERPQLGAVVVQVLVGVAAPVGEVHLVILVQLTQALGQPGQVGAPVDQRPDQVAVGPGLAVGTPPPVDPGGRVAALVGGQEPVGGLSHAGQLPFRRPEATSRGRSSGRIVRARTSHDEVPR
jgi:hypothetical protein